MSFLPTFCSLGFHKHRRAGHTIALYTAFATVLLLGCGSTWAQPITVVAWGDNDYGECDVPEGLTDVRSVVAGYDRSLALRSNGTVVVWGEFNTGDDVTAPGLSNVVAIDSNFGHALALFNDGTVGVWGNGYYGEASLPSGLTGIIGITAGWYHNLALRDNGTVVGWGGQDGAGDPPSGLSSVTAVSAGGTHSMALKSDGTVSAWGWNSFGQGSVPEGVDHVVAISGGGYHNLVLKDDGTVFGWGYNDDGQTTPPDGLSNIVAISAGGWHNLALDSDGNIVTWGYAGRTLGTLPVGINNVVSISAGHVHNLVLCRSWTPIISLSPTAGAHYAGTTLKLKVVAVGPGPLQYQWQKDGTDLTGETNTALTLSNVQVEDNGTYVALVSNSSGVTPSHGAVLTVVPYLAITNQPSGKTAVLDEDTFFLVQAIGSEPLSYQWFKDGSALSDATNAVLNIHGVQTTDAGNYYVIVSNIAATNTSSVATLTVIEPIPAFTLQPRSLAVFLGGKATFEAALQGRQPFAYQWTKDDEPIENATDRTLTFGSVALGDEATYQLIVTNSFGSTTSAPVRLDIYSRPALSLSPPGTVVGLDAPTVPPGLTNVVAVAAGYAHALALNADGTVTAWGRNMYGESDVPPDLTDVVAISAGNRQSLAVRSNGTVVEWGVNGAYEVPGVYGAIAVAAGDYNLALSVDGRMTAWGGSGVRYVPTDLTDVVAIDAGWFVFGLALRSDGTVTSWGLGIPPLRGASDIKAISLAQRHALALRNDGTVVGTELSNIVAIAAGDGNYGLALRMDGTVAGLGGAVIPEGLSGVSVVAAGEGRQPFGLVITTNAPQPVLALIKTQWGLAIVSPVSVSGYTLEAADPSLPQGFVPVTAFTNSFIFNQEENPGFNVSSPESVMIFRLRKQ